MWATNLKIVGVVLGTLALYTLIANKIPQLQSEVPQALALGANVTPEQLVAAGEKLFNGAGGCTTCHGLGTRAPNLLTDEKGTGLIGSRCGKPGGRGRREPGRRRVRGREPRPDGDHQRRRLPRLPQAERRGGPDRARPDTRWGAAQRGVDPPQDPRPDGVDREGLREAGRDY